MSPERLTSYVPALAGRRVLVAGDIILDEYVIGAAQRMSREAPIPVLEFLERRFIPGGAANPASNIVALGSTPVQVGLVGRDAPADHLLRELDARGILTGQILTCEGRPTTVKTRIMASMGLRFPQQVARIDVISREPVDQALSGRIMERIHEQAGQVDAILLSDYHTGMLTPPLVRAIREAGRAAGTLLTADAQGWLEKYAGFDLVKCNAEDASEYLGQALHTDDDFAAAARHLCAELALQQCMVITRGASGATLALANGETLHSPAPAVSDVFDTVGAGDTSIAVLTLARVAGATYAEAALLANYASGIVVRHVGNYTPSPAELRAALERPTQAGAARQLNDHEAKDDVDTP